VDPDPHGTEMILVGWIWMQLCMGMRIWIWIKEGKNDPQKLKKVEKCHVYKGWLFCFES
jgi:hypothetical protein